MSLTLPDVKRVARLARIAITDDEAVLYQQQINGIFSLITQTLAQVLRVRHRRYTTRVNRLHLRD